MRIDRKELLPVWLNQVHSSMKNIEKKTTKFDKKTSVLIQVCLKLKKKFPVKQLVDTLEESYANLK